MRMNIIIALKKNPIYMEYISKNPQWFKYLNRDPSSFEVFEMQVKKAYKLRFSDKLENVTEQISLIADIMDILN